MRREEYIYVQTGVCVRNRDQINVNTSSDFCFVDETTFEVSGATKIIEDYKTCDFSGITYADVLSAGTECFFTQELSGSCFNGALWYTHVVADGTTVNETEFFSSTGTTGDLPTDDDFVGSVVTALDTLGYNYVQSGTTFTIEKPFGVADLRFDICIELDIDPDCKVTGSTCPCPVGYSATTAGDSCVFLISTGATFNGSNETVIAGDTNAAYNRFGANFYETSNGRPLPIEASGSSLLDASGNTLNIEQGNIENGLWGFDPGQTSSDGRLNNVGVWGATAPNNEWIGFSHCIDVPTPGEYTVGISSDNRVRFKVNGELTVEFGFNGGSGYSFNYWHVIPIYLNSGLNIIEIEGYNNGADASFGAEIYDVGIDVLSGITSESGLTGNTIFSTKDKLGDTFEIGQTIGYSCPTGYTLDTCVSGTPVCTLIDYSDPDPCPWTGSCETACVYTACSQTFEVLQSGDTGVYIIEDETEIDFTFNFTGNTSSINSDTNFKYEVYKYDDLAQVFVSPAVYESGPIPYSEISGTTQDILVDSIPVNSLLLDGDYLIKGYFDYEACTEFASRLGIRLDTSETKTGEEYGLYTPSEDWYFVAMTAADEPIFNQTSTGGLALGNLQAYTIFPDFDGQTGYTIANNYAGDIMVNLNGLTLSPGNDYTLTGSTLDFAAPTVSGDVITIVQVVGEDSGSLFNDTYKVTSPIVSGATDGEGTETVYYNTDTGKYEVFTSVTPASPDIVLTLNGATLANNIDYYQSTSNPKRIILEGDIVVGDVINLFYNPTTTFAGEIFTNENTVSFTIENAPQQANGFFVLEVAEEADTTFSALTYTATTEYVPGQATYTLPLVISGDFGDKFRYRVKNQKEYVSLSGDKIIDIEYSEVIIVELVVNNLNAY